MKTTKLASKAIGCKIPKAVLDPLRGTKEQKPPSSSTPIRQRQQLAGNSL